MTIADQPSQFDPHAPVILCADDYAMTNGISDAIDELSNLRRLSATSVMVTLRHWPEHAQRLLAQRDRLAIALHFNLTLGAPAGPMPRLAPGGKFPPLSRLLAASLSRQLNEAEIAAEVSRQLDRFEEALGHPPDIVDGHQHVHVLPQIRNALLDTLSKRYPDRKPLIRDPADTPTAIVARGAVVPKALGLAALAKGFGRRARALGFPTNDGFSGVSAFDENVTFAGELARFFSHPGRRHLVMCHPGFPDTELKDLDPVVERRRAEFEALRDAPGLPDHIWHPARDSDGRIRWDGADG